MHLNVGIFALQLEKSGMNTEVEKELNLRKNLNEQVKGLKEELEAANRGRTEAEQENKRLQCKLCCMEKKLRETEENKDKELKKR